MIRRRKINPPSYYDKFEDIEKVNNADGGFYNPTEDSYGKFYIKFTGVPSTVYIRYIGNIKIRMNSLLDDKILIRNVRESNRIMILNINAKVFNEELLFEYSGKIEKIIQATVTGFMTKPFVARLIEYDQTNLPLGKSRTNVEDDSIIMKEGVEIQALPELENLSNFEDLKISSNLPEDYVRNKTSLDEEKIKELEFSKRCLNCFYFKNNYCELWDAVVNPMGWCESWRGIKENINGL
jgi:hypothetical protein